MSKILKSKLVHVNVTEEMFTFLVELAKEKETSVATVIRQFIKNEIKSNGLEIK